MKTWKKVVIGIVAVGVVGLGVFTYGIVKLSNNVMEKLEPEMKQYVKMSTEEQDKYVIDNMENLLFKLKQFDDEDSISLIKTNPAVRQAGIDVGRSLCASVIVDTDSIAAELTPAEKEKYKKEAAEAEARNDKFSKEMERALKNKK